MLDRITKIFQVSKSVVVYRCSPLEKASIIAKMMEVDPTVFCCAIGDGGNDINMIQTAHVGVGIEGNEGNQAAFFADYSVPEFKGLRRLVLWHGRNFGQKAFSVFLPNTIFAGHIFMAVMFWSNWMNGFSGENIFKGFYFSLYSVLNTNVCPLIYLLFEYDVEYDPKVKTPMSYTPVSEHFLNKKEGFDKYVERMFDTTKYVKSLGYTFNSDGKSTNNLTASFANVRDTVVNNVDWYFWFYFVVAFSGGSFAYFFILQTFSDAVGQDGQVQDMWNNGVCVFYTMLMVHYVLFVIETRSWNFWTFVGYLVAYATIMPMVINLNDGGSSHYYGGSQWTMVFDRPVMHLITMITTFIIVLPRYLWLVYQHVFMYPEFQKIKSS